ncbi:MAG TPA: TlyA family RNA methyltransferase [Atribacteraceae bacterium]|nr:TlyA family RNA methyltransferase [Atribacteraceae bacterium]
MKKTRLDEYLVEQGLCESREQAKRLILAGSVVLEPIRGILKPSSPVASWSRVIVKESPRYVSRGGEKLEKALRIFNEDPTGLVYADIGASTGGFTDCLLQHGARRVFAVDVGSGILHERIRRDPRVVLLEKTNARFLKPDLLGQTVDGLTIDVSFISLNLLWSTVTVLVKPDGSTIALIKPQFEAGRDLVDRGGVVKKKQTHRLTLQKVIEHAEEYNLALQGLTFSPLRGPKGNIEFLGYWRKRSGIFTKTDHRDIIGEVVEQAWCSFGLE